MFIVNLEEISPPIQTYRCGSPPLKDFLIRNNIMPVYKYTHTKNNRTIWVFVQCDELSKLLTEWSNNKPLLKKGGEIIGE